MLAHSLTCAHNIWNIKQYISELYQDWGSIQVKRASYKLNLAQQKCWIAECEKAFDMIFKERERWKTQSRHSRIGKEW